MYMYNSKKKILHATSIVEKKNLVTFQIFYIRVNMTFSTKSQFHINYINIKIKLPLNSTMK